MSNKKKLVFKPGNPETFERKCMRVLTAPNKLEHTLRHWEKPTYQTKKPGKDPWPDSFDIAVKGRRV